MPRPSTAEAVRNRAAPMSPPERRAAIIDATIPLLRAHGRSITTRQIADAAGVAEGTIFSVFPDKDTVVSQAVDAALDPEPIAKRLGEIDLAQPLEVRMTEAVDVIREHLAGIWELLAAVEKTDLGPRRASSAAKAKKRKARMLHPDVLAALFEPSRHELSRPPALAGQTLLALTVASSNPYVFETPMPSAEIVALLLDGLRSRGTGR